jgi:predicted esterase
MPTKKSVVLCLHGYGTNAAIFRVQTRHLRAALASEMQFIFVDAPFTSPPGPGVLPYFADCGPFYSWSSTRSEFSVASNEVDTTTVLATIVQCLAKHRLSVKDVVGILGFSQGAVVASLLSFLAERQPSSWPRLRLAILLCGAYHDVLPKIFNGNRLNIASIHVHGLKDPLLKSSRLLYSSTFKEDVAVKIEMDIAHTLPHEAFDVFRVAGRVREVMLYG